MVNPSRKNSWLTLKVFLKNVYHCQNSKLWKVLFDGQIELDRLVHPPCKALEMNQFLKQCHSHFTIYYSLVTDPNNRPCLVYQNSYLVYLHLNSPTCHKKIYE